MKRILSRLGLLSVLLLIFIGFSINSVEAYTPGNVLINEFVINTDPGVNQWYELMNGTSADIDLTNWVLSSAINGELSIGTQLGTSSKILPAFGLLTIPVNYNPADDTGDVLQIKDPTSQAIHAVSYGDQPFPAAPNHVDAPTSAQSAILTNLGTTWSATTTITRGWYNDDSVAPTITAIIAIINAGGIFTNMDTATDTTAVTDLYFEKRTDVSSSTTALGRLTFAGPLNLTNASTTAILQELGTKMEAAAGSMSFDARTANDLKDAGATISIFHMDDTGYDLADLDLLNITVRDDLGVIIATSSVDYPSLSSLSTSTENYGTFTFTTDHFTGFGFDPILVEITPVSTPTASTSPYYTFSSNATGTTVYGGSCISGSASTTNGNNIVQFGPLSVGTYADCTITVIDGVGASSTLTVTPFVISVPIFIDTNVNNTYDLGEQSFDTIQDAVDTAISGDTIYVTAGTYSDNVTIDKQLTLIGASSSTVIVNASSSESSVFFVASSSVSISGFTINGATAAGQAGIYINAGVSSSTISNNILTGNYDGVWLGSGSNNNSLENNNLTSNYQGFEVYHSDYNNFTNNISSSNSNYGFKMESADYNTFTDNVANSNAKYGFYFSAGTSNSDNNTLTNNTANSNTEYGIRMNSGTGNTLIGNTFNSNVIDGIRLKDVITNLTLNNNSFTNSQIGIDIATVGMDLASWSLTNNNISGNSTYNIVNVSTSTLTATSTWWGSSVKATVEASINSSSTVNFLPYYISSGMTTLSDIKAITGFTIPGQTVSTTIDESTYAISLTMPYGTDVTSLVPTITITGASVDPISGTSTDFTSTTIYTVTAIDETIQAYDVTVSLAPNSAKAITGFTIPTQVGSTTISESAHTITIVMPNGTNVSALVSTFITTGSLVEIGEITQISGSTSVDFSSPVTYTVTADDASTQAYVVTVQVLETTQTAPVDGEATISTTTPEVVITDPTATTTLTINTGVTNPTIDVSAFIGSNGTGTIPAIIIDSTVADVSIPASTLVTSASTTWDGIIAAPVATTITLPTESGVTKTFSAGIEVGFSGVALTFNKAVRILLPGQAGKRVGYTRDAGTTFTEITTTCSADTQVAGDAMSAGAECKMDSGSDLVIWTKHFTTFASYSQTTNTVTSSGGGGWLPPVVTPVATSTTAVLTTTTALPTIGHKFTKDLQVGSQGADVTELQKILVAEGHLIMPKGVAYGYFGSLTKQAVIKYQLAKGITPAAGYFGPKTMKILTSSNVSTTSIPATKNIASMTLKELVQMLLDIGAIASDKIDAAQKLINTL